MPGHKMMPPLPDTLGESEHDRFVKFARAILSVPKTEITPPEQTLSKLEAEKEKVDAKIVEVRREMAKRKRSIL